VPAAGVGSRMGAAIPKQYLALADQTVLGVSLKKLRALKPSRMVVALHPDDRHFNQKDYQDIERVDGGDSRARSVLAGLAALEAQQDDWVLVHDAVRPCVRVADMQALVDAVFGDPVGGLLAIPVKDTLKRVGSDRSLETVDRRDLWQAQTPQLFRFGVLFKALTAQPDATDEASAVEALGLQPKVVLGRADNLKITVSEDLTLAAYILAGQSA